jgi:hypothetical protein
MSNKIKFKCNQCNVIVKRKIDRLIVRDGQKYCSNECETKDRGQPCQAQK